MFEGRKVSMEWRSPKEFELLKKKAIETPILVLLDFNKLLEVDCDTLGVGIGAMLSQEGKPIAFFSEKLNECKKNYSAYNK